MFLIKILAGQVMGLIVNSAYSAITNSISSPPLTPTGPGLVRKVAETGVVMTFGGPLAHNKV